EVGKSHAVALHPQHPLQVCDGDHLVKNGRVETRPAALLTHTGLAEDVPRRKTVGVLAWRMQHELEERCQATASAILMPDPQVVADVHRDKRKCDPPAG